MDGSKWLEKVDSKPDWRGHTSTHYMGALDLQCVSSVVEVKHNFVSTCFLEDLCEEHYHLGAYLAARNVISVRNFLAKYLGIVQLNLPACYNLFQGRLDCGQVNPRVKVHGDTGWVTSAIDVLRIAVADFIRRATGVLKQPSGLVYCVEAVLILHISPCVLIKSR